MNDFYADLIPAEFDGEFDFEGLERDGWSEQYDYPDEDFDGEGDFGWEDTYLDSYWEAQGEAMLAFWGE